MLKQFNHESNAWIAQMQNDIELKQAAIDEVLARGGEAAQDAWAHAQEVQPQPEPQQQPQQHGGWGPRAAALVRAYVYGDWEECERLCYTYQVRYAWFARLVQREQPGQ